MELKDNSKRAKNTIVALWIVLIIIVISTISSYLELSLLKRFQNEEIIDISIFDENDLRVFIIGIIQFASNITFFILFLFWFRRAYANLHRLNIKYLKCKDNMAVWGWFIPIIFLFRPVQIMSEIWDETQIQIKKYDKEYSVKSGGVLIGVWWAMFLIANYMGKRAFKTSFKAETVEQFINNDILIIIANGMEIVAKLLLIVIIGKVSKMEKILAKLVKENSEYITK